jgi:gliding motility-associated-like protein
MVVRDINVSAVNDAPVLASIEAAELPYSEGQVATVVTATTTVTDVDNANIASATVQITGNYLNTEDVLAFTNAFGINGTWTAGTGTLTLTGSATLANYQTALRSITYQNTNNNNPSTLTRTVSFTVNDGGLSSNTVSRDISVSAVNDAPIATDDAVSTNEDTPVQIDILVNDSDSDNSLDPATVVATTPTNGVININSSNGFITYTPNTDFNGADTFSYTIKDITGAESNSAIVTITVIPVNDGPIADDDNNTTSENLAVNIPILSNDTDADNSIDPTSVSIISNVSNGSLLIDPSTGMATYTPNVGFIGNDTFTYTVADALGTISNTAVVTIVVNPINDPPLAVDDGPLSHNTGLPLTIDALGNDSDPDNIITELSIIGVTSPTFGSTRIENNMIVYEPSGTSSGTVTFSYTIQDPEGLTSTAIVTIIYEYIELEVSEGFSPNDDGNNDTWHIRSIESYPGNNIKVFDRWGLLVYQVSNYDNTSIAWNGRANTGNQAGNYLEQGTYYYVLDLGANTKAFSGFVVIVR